MKTFRFFFLLTVVVVVISSLLVTPSLAAEDDVHVRVSSRSRRSKEYLKNFYNEDGVNPVDKICTNLIVSVHSLSLKRALTKIGSKLGYIGNHAQTVIHPHVTCQTARSQDDEKAALKRNLVEGETTPKCLNDFSAPFSRWSPFRDTGKFIQLKTAPAQPRDTVSFDNESGVTRFHPPLDLSSHDPLGRTSVQCFIHTRFGGTRYRLGTFRVSLSDFEKDPSPRDVPVMGIAEKRFGIDFRGDGLGHVGRRWWRDFKEKRDPSLKPTGGVAFLRKHEYRIKGPTIDYALGELLGSARVSLKCAKRDDFVERFRRLIRKRIEMSKQFRSVVRIGMMEFKRAAPGCPMVFAHRGASDPVTSRENSISAMHITSSLGFQGAEIDVFWTKDGLLVTHDKTLDRQYAIGISVEDVAKLGLAKDLEEATGCTMFPKLEDFLKSARDTGLLLDIELKPETPELNPMNDYATKIGSEVGDAIRAAGMEKSVVVTAIDSAKLTHVNGDGKAPIRVGLAQHTGLGARALHAAEKLRRNIPANVPRATIAHYDLINPEMVKKAHARNEVVGTYTLFALTEIWTEKDIENGVTPTKKTGPSFDDATIERVIKSGVDWIETDDPIRLEEIVLKNCAHDNAQVRSRQAVISDFDERMNKRVAGIS